MTLPLTLPAWAPPWLPFLVLVAAALYLLVFLIMPFSVFGVKSRLDSLEAELDEIHAEIRRLALRLPESLEAEPYEDARRLAPRDDFYQDRPPIPPAPEISRGEFAEAHAPRQAALHRASRRATNEARSPRAEPKLDWPR